MLEILENGLKPLSFCFNSCKGEILENLSEMECWSYFSLILLSFGDFIVLVVVVKAFMKAKTRVYGGESLE